MKRLVRRSSPCSVAAVLGNPAAAQAPCSTVIARARVSKATLLCHIVVKLSDGTLTAEALTNNSIPTSTGAITGGSGAYIGARGSVVSVLQANEDSKDTIMLLD